MVDSTEPTTPDDPSAVEAVAGLPYLIGLREARREPRPALEGMGHSGAALDALAAQLEAAVEGPAWVLALADLTDDGWDTPEGYRRWVEAAEAASAAPWLGAVETSADPAWPDVLVAPARAGSPMGAELDAAAPSEEAAAAHRPGPATPEPVPAETASAFAPVEAVLERHAERRRSTEQRLQESFNRRAEAARKRRELEAQLETLDAEDASAAAEEEQATGELDLLADAEAADRRLVVTQILAAGRAALDESAATWSVDADPRDERDRVSLAAAERTVADFDAMERGGCSQLPDAVRAKLTSDAEAARATLHAMLGGRDPVRVPIVVAASADPTLALRVALPFAGRDELVPGGLHTAVAIAVAGALAETVEAGLGGATRDRRARDPRERDLDRRIPLLRPSARAGRGVCRVRGHESDRSHPH